MRIRWGRIWALLAADSEDGLHFKVLNEGEGQLYHPPLPECGPLLTEVARNLRRDAALPTFSGASVLFRILTFVFIRFLPVRMVFRTEAGDRGQAPMREAAPQSGLILEA